jgi:hypothetical protein
MQISIGDRVTWKSGLAWRQEGDVPEKRILQGKVIDIEDSGTLVVEMPNGKIISVDPSKATNYGPVKENVNMKTDKANILIEAFNPYAWMKQPEKLQEKVTATSSGDAIENAFRKIEDQIDGMDSTIDKISARKGEFRENDISRLKKISKDAERMQKELEAVRDAAAGSVSSKRNPNFTDKIGPSQIDVLRDMRGQYGLNTLNHLKLLVRKANGLIKVG